MIQKYDEDTKWHCNYKHEGMTLYYETMNGQLLKKKKTVSQHDYVEIYTLSEPRKPAHSSAHNC